MLRMSLNAQRPSSLGKPSSTSKLGFRPPSSGRALRVPPLLRATPDHAREASQEEARRGGPPMQPVTKQDQSHESPRTPSHEDRVAAALLAAEGLAKTAVTLAAREHAQAGGEELMQLMRAVVMRLDASSPPGQQEQQQQQDQVTHALESLAGSSQRTEELLSDILAVLQQLPERAPSTSEGVTPYRVPLAVAVGDRVRMRRDVTEPIDWGREFHGMVGVVRSIKEDQGICFIEYPEVNSCIFRRLNEVEVVPKGSEEEEEEEEEERSIRVGALVRTSLSSPYRGAMGIVTAQDEDAASVTVKLPFFFGDIDVDVNELVVVPLAPGMRVRVRRDCYEPTESWGRVNHGSVGVVFSVEEDGSCLVDFPECDGWNGVVDEMQVVMDDEVKMEGEGECDGSSGKEQEEDEEEDEDGEDDDEGEEEGMDEDGDEGEEDKYEEDKEEGGDLRP
ncbi:hypothetical protein FOA52_003160 [Chlamydomonas sp. UWO 241]|nr:hypothetical protein FOA52_003160 [Chlamydomonas sp. UWO 241]